MPQIILDDADEEHLTQLWDALLSRELSKIQKAYTNLTKTEQKAVLGHLKEMVEGEGWQPGQRESARAALKAIESQV